MKKRKQKIYHMDSLEAEAVDFLKTKYHKDYLTQRLWNATVFLLKHHIKNFLDEKT